MPKIAPTPTEQAGRERLSNAANWLAACCAISRRGTCVLAAIPMTQLTEPVECLGQQLSPLREVG